MPFSVKQREYFDNADKRWNFKTGATRSGKTYMDYFVIPKRIRARIGLPGLAVILGVTKSTIERNILEPMRNIWGADLVGEINSQNICYLFGERVYCLGAEKISQVSKLRGASIKYVYGDEVADWNPEVFDMLKSRLDKPYSCFDGALNPQGPGHWLKSFIDNPDFDIYCQKYTIFDNPFLPKEFVENLCKEYEGTVYYLRYILGEWALAEGLVYKFGEENITDSQQQGAEYYISIDYGTLNPFSAGLWSVTGSKAVRIKEYYYDGRNTKRQLTDEEYCNEIEKLAKDRLITKVIVDPSAASFITALKRRGFRVQQADNSVLDGIRRTSVYLKNGNIKIHRSCVDSIREFGLYRWDDKKTVDTVVKENDHAMDDIRYFCNTIMRKRVRET
jgi:PBSX family phage terminase large subunit